MLTGGQSGEDSLISRHIGCYLLNFASLNIVYES